MNLIKKMSCFVLIAGFAFADASHDSPAAKSSAEFERVKQLVGIWKGSSSEKGGKSKQDATAVYQLSSGGQIVVETLFAGTPHEMTSVYYDKGGKLAMTHYCMLPNRPVLELQKADAKKLELSLTNSTEIPATEHHMHALSLTWKGPDQLTQRWTSWKDGKPEGPTVITLSRVK